MEEACEAKWRDISYANVEHMNGLNGMANYMSGQVKRVNLSVFKSVESMHGCVIVTSHFESRDSPAHSHRIMCRVSWDVIPSDALQDNNSLRVRWNKNK